MDYISKDYISNISSDITGNILSFASDNNELAEMSILLPNAGKIYDKKRSDAEFWLEQLEKYCLKKPLPLSYSENAAKLERYFNLCGSYRGNAIFINYLPELLDLCDLSAEDYTKKELKIFVIMYIETALLVSVNLVNVIMEKPYFDEKMFLDSTFEPIFNHEIKKFLPLYKICKKHFRGRKMKRILKQRFTIDFFDGNLQLIKDETDNIKAEIPSFNFKFEILDDDVLNESGEKYLRDGIVRDNIIFPELSLALCDIPWDILIEYSINWNFPAGITHNALLILLELTIDKRTWNALLNFANLEDSIEKLEIVFSDPLLANQKVLKEKLDRLKAEYKK